MKQNIKKIIIILVIGLSIFFIYKITHPSVGKVVVDGSKMFETHAPLKTIETKVVEAQELAKVELKVESVGTVNCGSDPYMAYIYQKESGCRTTAVNPQGCYGIGQACPASKIAHCGADFACQDAWFRNYAISRYGSTYQAYQVWLSQRWW